MSSRDDILASIRATTTRGPAAASRTTVDDDPPASLLSAFKDNLHRMGGVFLRSPTSADILAPVRAKDRGRQIVCSTVPEIAGNREISLGVRAATGTGGILILPSSERSFAVAETGSVS